MASEPWVILEFWSLAVAFLALTVLALAIAMVWTVNVRRFHDRGKSGWWLLLYFVPAIGQLWLLIELGLLGGQSGTNRYGPPLP